MEDYRWNLQDIVHEECFAELCKQTKEKIASFAQKKSLLHPTMDTSLFSTLLTEHEILAAEVARISAFAELKEAADLVSEEAKVYKTKAEQLYIAFQEATLPLFLWLKGLAVDGLALLNEQDATRLFTAVPSLCYVLQTAREQAKYNRTEAEERILSRKKITGPRPLFSLYQLLTDRFTFTFEAHGEKKTITSKEELLMYAHSNDAHEREACYRALFAPYQDNLQSLFVIYSALVNDWDDDAQLRGFPNVIAPRHLSNTISDAVVNTLLEVCREQRILFHEFFQLKAKALKIDKLRRYDIYARYGKHQKTYNHATAESLVFSAFSQFSPSFAEHAKKILEHQHLDSHARKNKTSGAFCAAVTPDNLPYVLTNFNGTEHAVFTLAHELGHAVHDIYASQQSISAMQPGLPLAETASTFAELLLFETSYQKATSKEEKITLLIDSISDAYATILRQVYFSLFELEAHRLLREGAKATELCSVYLTFLREQFGDSVLVSDDFGVEWTYIPHLFASPFYCYAYAFGELLSLSLYAAYQQEGASFVPKIERILSAGGSRDPEELLREAGFNLTDKHFWEQSFSVLQKRVDELKKLLEDDANSCT